MRRTRTLILTCTLLALTAACTADAGPAGQRTTRPTSPAATSTPTEPNEPAPPTLPALAEKKTTAGAKAFVTYYIDVLNLSATNNAVSLLQTIPSEGCRVCRQLIRTIKGNKARGGRQVGGTWSLAHINLIGMPEAPVAIADLDVESGFYQRFSTDRRHRIENRRIVYQFWLTWTGRSWSLADIRSV